MAQTVISTTNNRLVEIDIYRGIAILLVILGHSFCEFPIDLKGEFNSFHLYISSFNMQMFFWISGLLFSTKDTWRLFITKKSKRLLLPWIVFVVLSIVLRTVAGAFTHSQIGSIAHELILAVTTAKYYWFIYALFLMMLLSFSINNKYVLAFLGGALLLISLFNLKLSWNSLLIHRLIIFYPWFIGGYLLKDYYLAIRRFINNNIRAFLILAVLVFFTITTLFFKGFLFDFSLVVSLSLCFSLWVMSLWLCSRIQGETILSYFGKYSLQYYLNHCLIMIVCFYAGAKVYEFSPILSLLIIFILGLIISTIMLAIEKKSRLLRLLCGFNK